MGKHSVGPSIHAEAKTRNVLVETMPARVLVVAAQAEIQLQLGNMLRRDGHEILVGNNGAEGFRRWSSRPT